MKKFPPDLISQHDESHGQKACTSKSVKLSAGLAKCHVADFGETEV